MSGKAQNVTIAILILLLALMIACGGAVGRSGVLWMRWVSEFGFSVLLIAPGVALIFRKPHIAYAWADTSIFRNSTWEELSLFKKVLMYIGVIMQLIIGVVFLCMTIFDILSRLEM